MAYHYALGRQVTHTHLSSGARAASVEVKEIESLPQEIIENQKQYVLIKPDESMNMRQLTERRYRIYHDKIVKFLPNFTVAISNKNEELFTRVMRRNMVRQPSSGSRLSSKVLY